MKRNEKVKCPDGVTRTGMQIANLFNLSFDGWNVRLTRHNDFQKAWDIGESKNITNKKRTVFKQKKRKEVAIDRPERSCLKGDRVAAKGITYEVAEVISEPIFDQGQHKGIKAIISGHRIMSNGQVLRRSSVYLHTDWELMA